ncbi:ribbon-helix-helix protein, CopG family [Alphaproteobacteria bacterium]|nr:ribbon-helix-helix protein, CopG family [Alphaproteobacteria bacterium]
MDTKRYRSVAMQMDVYQKILELAKKEERSLNAIIKRAISQYCFNEYNEKVEFTFNKK